MKISLITATYNRAHTIRDTLMSVNAQTYPSIEHIVLDGASSDDTMRIVEELGQRVCLAVSEPDKGVYDAYNKGLTKVSGEVIGFINSDDFYSSNTVIEQVARAFEDPQLEAVHADLVYVDIDDTKKITRHWKGRDYAPADIARGFIPAHPTVFLRRSVYDRIGGFDTRYRLAADYEFLLRAFYKENIRSRHIPDIWVHMRAGGVTGGNVNSVIRQNQEIRRAQDVHGIHYSRAKFIGHKVIDRSLQRLRAPFVKLPQPAF